MLKIKKLDTPIGPMTAIGDDTTLYLLEFEDYPDLEREIERLQMKICSTITQGYTQSIRSIEEELKRYFRGELKEFKTPITLLGTPFQNQVWRQLQKIPFAQTRSYRDMACAIKRPTAFRAAAQANRANQLAIIIPCHRVINADGKLGGYAGGIARKKWLLNHEQETR